jgi:predicted glycosyltransferase
MTHALEMGKAFALPTRKHVRYGHAIAQRLRKFGHQLILTTREHPDTSSVMKALGEEFKIVGKYDPTSLASRFRASIERELEFYKMFKDDRPDVAISHGSVELCRTAFALGVHNICTGDTIYTKANWLIVPLADTMLISKAIPKKIYQKYGAKNIIQFNGVDEIAWISQRGREDHWRGKRPLIIVRQSEFRASYMKGKDVMEELAKKLASLGTVVFLPRYEKKKVEGVVVQEGFVDSLSLVKEADLVVGVGGTIGREAALQGTPSIVMSQWRIHVNEFLAKKGFPLYEVKPQDVLRFSKKFLGKRINVSRLLAKLESPVDVISKLVSKVHHES